MEHIQAREMLETLIKTGRIFSQNKSFSEIFSELMQTFCAITGAEGGSLYIYDHNSKTLKVVVMTNTPLGVSKVVDQFDALKIKGFIEVPTVINGEKNLKTVSVCSFLENRKILVLSLEDDTEFDFTNTRNFDRANNYQTRNLAVLPLTGHNGEVIGVLQLINCNSDVFSAMMQPFIDAIAGQTGIMLSNALLVNKTQELMSAIIEMIGVAIDEKSPHTAGHCQRVEALTMLIAGELEKEKKDPKYKHFKLSNEQRRELRIAALLHDIGKIITPTHILEKQTKLYTLDDKINLLNERMRSWQLTRELHHLHEKLRAENLEHLITQPTTEHHQLEEDFHFLEEVNKGNIFVDEKTRQRLTEISNRLIGAANGRTPPHLINQDELDNLKIQRGTLNPSERKIMEDHVSISIRLLSSIPWPSELNKVVEYAGAHHENLNGTGYPNRLTGDQMALPARILGLADRFEGLSAPDRPYRSTKMMLSRVMMILEDMANKEEIDRDLFNFFKNKKLHLKYAHQYLPKEIIDC